MPPSPGEYFSQRWSFQEGDSEAGAILWRDPNNATSRTRGPEKFLERKRIFVTGATGFLGRHVVARLIDHGHALTLAVRDVRRCPAAWRDVQNISVLETGELGPETDFGDALSNADAVVHVAGLAHITANGSDAEARFMRANAGATEALVRAVQRSSVRSFVHVSSLAAVIPNVMAESVDDSTDRGPATPYGRSKRIAEQHVSKLIERDIFSISLRPPVIVGADARGNWAALEALAATGLPLPFASINNQRSFVSTDTLGDAISLLLEKDWPLNLSGEYCLADNEPLSLAEITRLLREGMGKPHRLFAFPAPAIGLAGTLTGRRQQIAAMIGDLKVDSSRFYQNFGFRPGVPLRTAISRAGTDYMRLRKRRAA